MILKRFVSKVLGVNVYIYYDNDSKDGIIIDPSGYMLDIYKYIEDNKVILKAVLLTHGHFDHITAAIEVKEKFNIPIVAAKEEVPVLNDSNINLSAKYIRNNPIEIMPDVLVEDGEDIVLGNVRLKNIFTPGHSVGSTCFYDDKNKLIFSGDTLFKEGIGRVDLELSVPEKIISSIKEKLFVLADDTKVYPGHGDDTTIGHEKENNPYIK